jgi:hypothetical protein
VAGDGVEVGVGGAGGEGGVIACKNLGASSFIDLADRTAEARSAARDTLNICRKLALYYY